MKPAHEIKFKVFTPPEDGLLITPGQWVFKTEEDWKRRGDEFERNGELFVTPWPDAPSINWHAESLILVSGGEFPTGPCTVEITRIEDHKPKAMLETKRTGPGNLQVLTHPWVMVSIHRKDIEAVEILKSVVNP